MKLKSPLNEYYDYKRIIKYKKEYFEENDKYITIILESDYEGIWYDFLHLFSIKSIF